MVVSVLERVEPYVRRINEHSTKKSQKNLGQGNDGMVPVLATLIKFKLSCLPGVIEMTFCSGETAPKLVLQSEPITHIHDI